MTEHPLVSIIIRTKNEERWITQCLDSIFKQSYRNLEVVLVDNESTDQTVHRAKQFDITLLTISEFRPGAAINQGIEASSGEIIVCLSGHCIPTSEDWLQNLIREVRYDGVAGVYGRQEPLSFSSDVDKRDLMLVFGLDRKEQTKDSFFHNANSAFRREVWEKFPFDAEATNIEDRIWGEQVIRAGFKIIYEPTASVFHWHGIHHNLNLDRARKIVGILESLPGLRAGPGKGYEEYQSQNIVAIVPVKGCSQELNSTTLLERTLQALKASKYIKEVVVFPDNAGTAKLASTLGAKTPYVREALLSGEMFSAFDALRSCLSLLEDEGQFPDLVVYVDETYPFRPPLLIDKLIEKLVSENLDSVVSVRPERRGVWLDDGESIKLINGGADPTGFSDRRMLISSAGLGYVARPLTIRRGDFFGGSCGMLEVPDPISHLQLKGAEDVMAFDPVARFWDEKNSLRSGSDSSQED